MKSEEIVKALDRAVRNGYTLDEACNFLQDALDVSNEEITTARALHLERVGVIFLMHRPRAFSDPKRVHGWYPGPSENDRFWPALRQRLLERRPEEVVDSIDQASNRVVSLLPNPAQPEFQGRGLVVGYIQSGKTANYSAVIAKAADVNYKFFIVLAGTHNPLREQTQNRLQEELSDLTPTEWIVLTSRDDDFRPQAAGNADAFLTGRTEQRTLCVVKKNATVLRRLLAWLRSAHKNVLQTCPVLIIDDEADVASVNAGRSAEERTVINRLIIEILETLPRVAYVGYTATPFANVLIDPSNQTDIYPRDFIVDLPRPDDYFGPERIFGRERLTADDTGVEFEGLDMVRVVPDEEVDLVRPRKAGDRASFTPDLAPSLERALRYFWMASAARLARGQNDEHSSMLIHTTMYVAVHEKLRSLIESVRNSLHHRLTANEADLLDDLRRQWEEEVVRVPPQEFNERPVSFDQLVPYLAEVVSRSEVVVENGQSARRLFYGEEAQPQIVIGGNTLSRGLTLEGLVVSYFVRSASAYDTLLQMGRWFGYRRGYEDLPRIWMTEELAEWFADLATVEQEIRYDIERYDRERLTPLEFGVRIRRHPQMAVTAKLKMQAAIECEISYSDQIVQTILFEHRDKDWLRANLNAGRRLLERLVGDGFPRCSRDGRHVFLKVPVDQIKSFLEEYQFHESATQLRADLLLGYIREQNTIGDLLVWDVGIVGRKPDLDVKMIELGPDVTVPMIDRARIDALQGHANLKTITSQRDRYIVQSVCSDRGNHQADGERGLLLLYPIDKDSRPAEGRSSRIPLDAVEDVLGVALVFPKSKQDTPQSYVTVDLSGIEREEAPVDDSDSIEDSAA